MTPKKPKAKPVKKKRVWKAWAVVDGPALVCDLNIEWYHWDGSFAPKGVEHPQYRMYKCRRDAVKCSGPADDVIRVEVRELD